jgi:hypothetical protein
VRKNPLLELWNYGTHGNYGNYGIMGIMELMGTHGNLWYYGMLIMGWKGLPFPFILSARGN